MSKSHSFTIAPLFKLLKAPANAQMKGNVTQQFLLWYLVTWHFSRDWAVLCSLHRPSADFFFQGEDKPTSKMVIIQPFSNHSEEHRFFSNWHITEPRGKASVWRQCWCKPKAPSLTPVSGTPVHQHSAPQSFILWHSLYQAYVLPLFLHPSFCFQWVLHTPCHTHASPRTGPVKCHITTLGQGWLEEGGGQGCCWEEVPITVFQYTSSLIQRSIL